ncbi:hypothetical protein Tsubulata_032168 [Turnera subulata]|uniref:DUF4283 domain-containing protein n=1 Tax=Turnera subulata TaxID=218843 RepID=A0A9Q0J069_9ROSI|nr:hypothetical protein Tsubulata_032168 [Turnera subulata]
MDQANLVALEFIEPATEGKRKKVANASYDEAVIEIEKWENALVGYVLGYDPELESVEKFIALNWKKYGEQILDQGPLFLDAKPFIVKRWEPSVLIRKEAVRSVPVWIKLPEESGIQGQRLTDPRICVEINADSELPEYVKFKYGLFDEVRVEYEWLPPLCTVCKEFGHLDDGNCSPSFFLQSLFQSSHVLQDHMP